MSTDPKKAAGDGSERRPSGAESKDERRAQPGGHRTAGGSDYGDWVPDKGQPQRNDDRDTDPVMQDYEATGGDLGKVPVEPGSPHPEADREREGTTRTGSFGEQVPDPDEAAAESRRNKDFDTTHVHSSTTSRKV